MTERIDEPRRSGAASERFSIGHAVRKIPHVQLTADHSPIWLAVARADFELSAGDQSPDAIFVFRTGAQQVLDDQCLPIEEVVVVLVPQNESLE